MKKIEHPPGQRFGFLTVIREELPKLYASGQTKRIFLFQCDCGNKCIATIDNVRRGKQVSCGCHHGTFKETHGKTKHPLYKIYSGIKERCFNKNTISYGDYGGRGITICSAWLDKENGFNNFYQWAIDKYKANLEIDRIDNNKGYGPDNCRFVTRSVNQRNKRTTITVQHPITGLTTTLLDLWEELGNPDLKYETIRTRYKYYNYSAIDAVTLPIKGQR